MACSVVSRLVCAHAMSSCIAVISSSATRFAYGVYFVMSNDLHYLLDIKLENLRSQRNYMHYLCNVMMEVIAPMMLSSYAVH